MQNLESVAQKRLSYCMRYVIGHFAWGERRRSKFSSTDYTVQTFLLEVQSLDKDFCILLKNRYFAYFTIFLSVSVCVCVNFIFVD